MALALMAISFSSATRNPEYLLVINGPYVVKAKFTFKVTSPFQIYLANGVRVKAQEGDTVEVYAIIDGNHCGGTIFYGRRVLEMYKSLYLSYFKVNGEIMAFDTTVDVVHVDDPAYTDVDIVVTTSAIREGGFIYLKVGDEDVIKGAFGASIKIDEIDPPLQISSSCTKGLQIWGSKGRVVVNEVLVGEYPSPLLPLVLLAALSVLFRFRYKGREA